MPTSMIRDRMIVYDSAFRRWYWGDDGTVLDEDVEAKHFSTTPPGQVWEEEDPPEQEPAPARSRRRRASAEEPADPPADPE